MSGRRNLSGRRCSTAVPRFDQLTPRAEEWDWPPTQRRYRTRFDVYQPSGWNSPGVKKAVSHLLASDDHHHQSTVCHTAFNHDRWRVLAILDHHHALTSR